MDNFIAFYRDLYRPKMPRIIDKCIHHHTVSFKQIIERIRVKALHLFIRIQSRFDLLNLFLGA